MSRSSVSRHVTSLCHCVLKFSALKKQSGYGRTQYTVQKKNNGSKVIVAQELHTFLTWAAETSCSWWRPKTKPRMDSGKNTWQLGYLSWKSRKREEKPYRNSTRKEDPWHFAKCLFCIGAVHSQCHSILPYPYRPRKGTQKRREGEEGEEGKSTWANACFASWRWTCWRWTWSTCSQEPWRGGQAEIARPNLQDDGTLGHQVGDRHERTHPSLDRVRQKIQLGGLQRTRGFDPGSLRKRFLDFN